MDRDDLESLDRCVALYRAFSLELPPDAAPLVEATDPSTQSSVGPMRLLGYRLGRKRAGLAPLWTGAAPVQRLPVGRPLAWTKIDIGEVDSPYAFRALLPQNGLLVLAVVERTRGHDALALKLFRRVKEESNLGFPQDWDLPHEDLPREDLGTQVAELAFSIHSSRLFVPGSDRAAILESLRPVVEGVPDLDYPGLNDPTARRTFESLRATVDGEGADHPLIDALCDSTEQGTMVDSPYVAQDAALRPIQAIVDQGFEIVPDLIAHLSDTRLTRAYSPAMMNRPAGLWTVGQTCRTILTGFRGEGDPDQSRRFEGWKKWWADAQALGERDYCLKTLKRSEGFPSGVLLRLARVRHPEVLREAFDAVVNRRRLVQVHPFLDAMLWSELPFESVHAAALKAARSRHLDQVHAGLWALHHLDQAAFDRELARTLDALPAQASGWAGAWLSREASFGQQAARSDSIEVWAALERATRRADVDLRLELISHAGGEESKGARLGLLLRYLLGFFNDRSEPSEPDDPLDRPRHHPFGTGVPVAQLAVALAAEHLDMETPPDEAEWAPFRERVRERARSFIETAIRET